MARHKVFLSFHKDDLTSVQAFIDRFDTGEDTFIYRAITMAEDVIDSDDPDYVMSQIRKRYLSDSTVTMVLMGQCTWARRFVDWEIQASLRQPENGKPNGLLAVMVDGSKTSAILPKRVKLNLDSGYAKFWAYPSSGTSLAAWIEDAYQARTQKPRLVVNPRDRRKQNGSCP